MAVHFLSLLGEGDLALVPHLIKHYTALGIDSFVIVCYGESRNDPKLESVESSLRSLGVVPYDLYTGPLFAGLSVMLLDQIKMKYPGDWFIIADGDEFQVYDREVSDIIDYCNKNKFDYVEGCFLDRIAEGGRLGAVNEDELWRQFPLAGTISEPLLKAYPNKVLLARGWTSLASGPHRARTGAGAPRDAIYGQVHHFKWTSTVTSLLQKRIERTNSGVWRPHPSVIKEGQRFLEHISRNRGAIDVSDLRFRVHPCDLRYESYPCWHEVVQLMSGNPVS